MVRKYFLLTGKGRKFNAGNIFFTGRKEGRDTGEFSAKKKIVLGREGRRWQFPAGQFFLTGKWMVIFKFSAGGVIFYVYGREGTVISGRQQEKKKKKTDGGGMVKYGGQYFNTSMTARLGNDFFFLTERDREFTPAALFFAGRDGEISAEELV